MRTAPKPGSLLWLVPIRYWEPDDYSPEMFTMESGGNGVGHLYGFHHGFGHNVYIEDHDQKWFYSEGSARKAQLLLKSLFELRNKDESHRLCEEIFNVKRQAS